MKRDDIRNFSEEEKATALKVIGQKLTKLEREHGEALVHWVAKRRHEQKLERARLNEEKKQLEARLAEIGSAA